VEETFYNGIYKRKKAMQFLKNFKAYILNETEGFGGNYFHVKKIDKSYCYFFKIEDPQSEERAFIIKFGKFSKGSLITDAEASYAVASIEEMDPSDMEAFLVDETPFKSREDETVTINMEELSKISVIMTKALDDYLEKAPKVNKIYNEFLENVDIDREEYINYSINTFNIWSKGRWNTQEGSSSKSLVHTKLSHD